MTSTVLAGQERLIGSFLTTSAVLNIPCMEHALTLNWKLQKHSLLFAGMSAKKYWPSPIACGSLTAPPVRNSSLSQPHTPGPF